MVRVYYFILKVLKLLMYVWVLTIFFSLFHFENVLTTSDGNLAILAFFGSLRNIVTYCFYGLVYVSAFGVIILVSNIFFVNPVFMRNFLDLFFQRYFSLWFIFPGGTNPQLEEIPGLLSNQLSILLNDFYLFSFQVLIVISIFYAIRAFIQTDPKNDMMAVGSLILMIVIPLMMYGLRDMFNLFYIQVEYLENLPNPLDPAFSQIPMDNFFQFIVSPVILLAIISYVYLELAFQINYTNVVTKPSLERKERLESQIRILQSESLHVTANIDKIKEEAKKRKEELEEKGKVSISKFFSRTEERFSYVKEMIEKRKLEEEEKKLITAASKTRRLGRYLDRLFREDPEAHNTITARSSAPRSRSLIISTLINFSSRFVILIIVSFIVMHPHWFLLYIFNLPPAITESVAMYSPEVVIILLIPIMLTFPVIAKIISFVKHRSLIIRLQQEGRIKEILASVGDYVKKEDVEEKEEDKESKVKESAAEAT